MFEICGNVQGVLKDPRGDVSQMQVIEPGAQPPALQIPLAEIVGLQFGLATSKEFVRI